MELTEAIKDHISSKLDSVERLCGTFAESVQLDVEVGKTTKHHQKGPYFFAEYNLQVPGQLIRARKEMEDLYQAIDAVKNDIRHQLKNYKDKQIERDQRATRPDKE